MIYRRDVPPGILRQDVDPVHAREIRLDQVEELARWLDEESVSPLHVSSEIVAWGRGSASHSQPFLGLIPGVLTRYSVLHRVERSET
jgi:hypothetical protein